MSEIFPRLKKLAIKNYKGVDKNGIFINFGPKDCVFCGPNNSGKTSILSSLQFLKKLTLSNVYMGGDKNHPPMSAQQPEYINVDDFYKQEEYCEFEISYEVPTSFLNIKETLLFLGFVISNEKIDFSFKIFVEKRTKKYFIEEIVADGHPYFKKNTANKYFQWQGNDSQGNPSYRLLPPYSNNALGFVFLELIGRLLQGTLVIPSKRETKNNTSVGFAAWDADGMTEKGIVQFLQLVQRANSKDEEAIKAYKLHRDFVTEFSEFLGLKINNVTPGSNDIIQYELNGELRSINSLGAGISEILIIFLISKIGRALNNVGRTPINTILIDEPELHLHPHLQRKLVNFFLNKEKYPVQFIFTTHSPTVLNVVQRAEGQIFQTGYKEAFDSVSCEEIKLGKAYELLAAIGANPSDLFLADKIVFVEGPHDVPVFKEWLSRIEGYEKQNISVFPLPGDGAASDSCDFSDIRKMNSNIYVIMDSEKDSEDAQLPEPRKKVKSKCEEFGIPNYFTEYKSTENYFNLDALREIYPKLKDLKDLRIGKFDKVEDVLKENGVKLDKKLNYRVAKLMKTNEIESTKLFKFLKETVIA